MQLRFLALAGPAEALDDHARRLLRPGRPAPRRLVDTPGLAVWAPRGTPFVAAGDGTAVAVGRVFDAASGAALTALPAPLPAAEAFVRRYWGAYVLLGRTDAGHVALRDPSGALTAYHRRAGAVDLYASDFEMLADAGLGPLEPDPGFLRAWLAYPYLRTAATGVRGVTELVPGEERRAAADRPASRLAWDPRAFARADRAIRDFDGAARVLREAVLRAVPRLAEGAGDVALHLSGGLDSSIVAAALADAGRPFRAVTFATRARDGDERTYARMVARHCGIELAELVEQPSAPDFERVPPPALRPLPHALLRPLHRTFDTFLALTGADLALDGAGGDNVFCFLPSATPVLDAFAAGAWGAAVAALDGVARVHDTTAWFVARAAWRRRRRTRTAWERDDSFLAPGAEPPPPAHPWLERPRAGRRGAFEQIQSIVGIRHFIRDPAPGLPATLHPLLAQPIVEASLRIPSWLWVRGGRDRAVARAAFHGLLPEAILARRSKGRLESLFVGGYMARRSQLEDLLAKGRLAQAGLVDVAAIRAYLHRPAQPADPGYIRLLDLAAAETWLRAFER